MKHHPVLPLKTALLCPAAFCILLVVALTGCTGTPYQALRPGNDTVGYTDRVLAPRAFLVSFSGNPRSDQKRVYDFALLRAAELVQKSGYAKFRIEKEFKTNGPTREISTSTSMTPYASDATLRRSYSQQLWYGSGDQFVTVDASVKVSITYILIVTAGNAEDLPDNVATHECDTVIRTVRKKYSL